MLFGTGYRSYDREAGKRGVRMLQMHCWEDASDMAAFVIDREKEK